MPFLRSKPAASSLLPYPKAKRRPVDRRKLVIVGDGACGKTSLLMAWAKGDFPAEHVPTVFENYLKEFPLDRKMVELALWDTAGQEGKPENKHL